MYSSLEDILGNPAESFHCKAHALVRTRLIIWLVGHLGRMPSLKSRLRTATLERLAQVMTAVLNEIDEDIVVREIRRFEFPTCGLCCDSMFGAGQRFDHAFSTATHLRLNLELGREFSPL